MSDTPLVSVVIPVWNRAHTIHACIESIKGPADPTSWEIILVDDGSTDDSVAATHESLAKLGLKDRARVIEQENGGPGAARNTGVSAAKGKWIAFLDSDDLWLPWTLPYLMDLLETHPDTEAGFLRQVSFTGDPADVEIEEGPAEVILYDGFLDAFLNEKSGLAFGSGIFFCTRELFERIGGFSHEMRVAEDQDLFLRLPLSGPFRVLRNPPTMLYRNMPDSLTKSFDGAYHGLKLILRAEASGAYPGGKGASRARRIALARITQFTIMNGWLNNRRWASYGLFLRSAWYLANNRCRLFILRYHQGIIREIPRALTKAFRRD